jgi:hypothetical protein
LAGFEAPEISPEGELNPCRPISHLACGTATRRGASRHTQDRPFLQKSSRGTGIATSRPMPILARTRGLRPVRACHLAAIAALVAVSGADASAQGLGSYRLEPGWATFGLAVPRGVVPAGRGLRVGALRTQTDVKTTWDDGSVRFAVLTAKSPSAQNYPITVGTLEAGTLTPIRPDATVEFAIAGARWIARMPAPLSDPWLSGPLVSEGRAIVAPMQGATAHPLLRVIFDVRSFQDGGHRIDVAVENSLDVPAGDAVRYDVTIRAGGKPLFEQTGVEHKYLARWRRVFALNLDEAGVVPDFSSFAAAQALPAYVKTIEGPARSTASPQFGLLHTGDLTVPMNAHGGRPEIAPYPDWTAQYIVHRRPDQRDYMLKHGDAAGSWGIHIKEPDGVRLISIDDHPRYWLDHRAYGDGRPQSVVATGGIRGMAVAADIAHQPSLAFVPYLVTGDRFYLDEMKYWANYCLIGTQPDDYARNEAQGLLISNEVRGIGWALRNLADTAAFLPDTDPYRHYFAQKLRNNLEWLEHYARTTDTPLDTLFGGHRRWAEDGARPPYVFIALWEHIYVAWAVDRALQLGFAPGAAFRDRVARLQLKLFTSGAEGFDRAFAAPYVLAVAEKRTSADRWTYLTSIREVFRLARSFGDYRPFPGYYGLEARLMLLLAGRQRWPGAADALDYLMGAADGDVTMTRDLNRRSGWALEDMGLPPQTVDRRLWTLSRTRVTQ